MAEKGQIGDNNDQVQSKGQPTRINGQIIDNIVVLAQIKVVIMEEEFIFGSSVKLFISRLSINCRKVSDNRQNFHLGKRRP